MKNTWSTRKVIVFLAFPTVILAMLCDLALAADERRLEVVVKDGSGQQVALYRGSYALLIGVSDYTAGWPSLNSVPSELDRVEAALKDKGFHVIRVMDPTGEALKRAFEDFIGMYGFHQNNRLLFFFSGHGHTREKGAKGYLVPADAPNPNKDRVGFLRKALPMNQILAWSRQVEAKHALFLFDSCFSGTVFKAKDLPESPPHISRATALPVRQYITAGDAGESVPAKSVFTPAFIDALKYGWGDLNKDGYVSGTELGLYLQEKVPQHSRQNPQYGKIKDYDLARGDFIFQLASSKTPSQPHPQYDSLQEERERLEQERRELERLKTEIERKRIEAERKRLEDEKKRLEVASLPQKPSYSRPSSSSSDVIKQDGVYIAYANGIVRDTKTGFEWKAGPDKDTDWNEARSWVQSLNLDGGGWRMPTMNELEGLYKKGAGKRNMTLLLKTTGWWVWSSETKGSSDARDFYFGSGFRYWGSRFNSYNGRAFAVRSRSDG